LTVGICTNLPSNCTKAAAKEPIPMPTPDTVCPECGSRLLARPDKAAGAVSPALILALVVGALLIAAVVAALTLMHGPHRGAAASGASADTSGGAAGGAGAYILRLSGSNTIGSDLGPDLVKAWLASKGASDIQDTQRRGPDGAPIPERVISATLSGQPVRVEVRAHGSATAFKDLAAGTADIGMASRPIKDDEVASLAKLGNMRTSPSENVLGLDGIAVIVPRGNAVASLSVAQLCQIFSGQISDWSQVGGGTTGPIHLYARDDNSGTYDAFKSMVLTCGALAPSAKRLEDSAALEADVSADASAIGFIGMPYVKTTRAVPISHGAAAALEPTVFTVKTESYALSRRLFLYAAAQPTNAYVRDFVDFALSPQGQAVVKQDQFVNLDPKPQAEPGAPAAVANTSCQLSAQWKGDPSEYCKLRAASQQLETSFRFLTNSSELDTRATADLKRVLDVMTQQPDKSIVLVGFADSSGTYAGNVALSQARAEAVGRALATLGLKAKEVKGFGAELPVRDNATAAGRELNRRVEIFLQ
jgi:phosphate transport system substrate-binding protein